KLHCYKTGWNRMRGGLVKELLAQGDDVFIRFTEHSFLASAVVPDPSFGEKIERRAMQNFGLRSQSVRAREDRGAERPLKSSDQSPIHFASVTHTEFRTLQRHS